ncbi:MAG: hypothetical protein ACI9SP_002742 [Arenicella sp.]|jgi:hypothetical protein
MSKTALFAGLVALSASFASSAYDAPFASVTPIIDGQANDSAWLAAQWQAIDQLTLGSQPSADDFSGRFKIVWTKSKLFLLGEITDDVLIDTHADPLALYWEDDTFEIFLDEDKSGGNHLDNYNAFAYHLSLDNQAIDYNSQGKPRLLNDHVSSVWKRSIEKPNTIIWEASFDVYPDTFKDQNNTAKPVTLVEGKEMGFMVAYCDSDGMDGRQHFIGSFDIPAINGDKNRGYIDASVFDSLKLVKAP